MNLPLEREREREREKTNSATSSILKSLRSLKRCKFAFTTALYTRGRALRFVDRFSASVCKLGLALESEEAQQLISGAVKHRENLDGRSATTQDAQLRD